MVEEQLEAVKNLYENNVKNMGLQPNSLGWNDLDSQILRFDKLVHGLKCETEAISVNDLGCGYGAMFPYLDELGAFELTDFYGYDISPEMIHVARQNIQDSRATFIEQSSLNTEADYTIVSGTFNVKFDATDKDWNAFMKDTILEMAKFSRKGISFNVLSSYVDWKESHLYYADPLEFFDFCKKNVSRYVTLLHDYPLYEWTIAVQMQE